MKISKEITWTWVTWGGLTHLSKARRLALNHGRRVLDSESSPSSLDSISPFHSPLSESNKKTNLRKISNFHSFQLMSWYASGRLKTNFFSFTNLSHYPLHRVRYPPLVLSSRDNLSGLLQSVVSLSIFENPLVPWLFLFLWKIHWKSGKIDRVKNGFKKLIIFLEMHTSN